MKKVTIYLLTSEGAARLIRRVATGQAAIDFCEAQDQGMFYYVDRGQNSMIFDAFNNKWREHGWDFTRVREETR